MDMEVEEIEAVLQKIWDLHDKLSDAIHSISRANFLDSIRSHSSNRKAKDGVSAGNYKKSNHVSAGNGDNEAGAAGTGYVYFKDFSAGFDSEYSAASLLEAKSLNAIRAALENLEDQLEFFHTVQVQQRAEREIAIARMEQSRVVLAMRLAEHQGKKYKVIEEAEAFLGDIQNATYSPAAAASSHTTAKFAAKRYGKRSAVCNLLFSGFDFVKKSMTGIICNAAMVAISMLVLVHVQQVGMKEDNYDSGHHHQSKEDIIHGRNMTKVFRPEGSSSGGGGGCDGGGGSTSLDVLSARG